MSVAIEFKKTKRTGFWPAFTAGGILAAAVPIVNMAVRSEIYTGASGEPLAILLKANWQMMAMLHMFLMILGACLIYHTEYADNAMQKMEMLPVSIFRMHISKVQILTAAGLAALLLENLSFAFCVHQWFETPSGFWIELLKSAGFTAILMFPVIFAVLAVAYLCKNMWVSLGICVICVFIVLVIPQTMSPDSAFVLFPFALPFQSFSFLTAKQVSRLLGAACTEIAVLMALQVVFLKIRRRWA